VNSWAGGFQGEVTVVARAATTSWSVSWRTSGERVDQVWNGTLSSQGGAVAVQGVSWNSKLAAGGSTTFGLLGSGTSPTPALTCTAS
jgi:cellulase/cellobiase CelA1